MASKFCLIKPLADQFRAKLKSGEIDPAKLANMSSDERHKFFADFLGEDNAKNVNALFESKLLLKNQKQGMITWAKKVTGISSSQRQDLIDKINSMEKVFSPKEGEPFLKDLASSTLGGDVTKEEAQKVFDLTQKVAEAEQAVNTNATKENIRNYGLAKIEVENYVGQINPHQNSFYENVRGIINIPRALKSTIDLSGPFRHAWGSMSRAAFWKNYGKMYQYLASEKSFVNKMADIKGHPDYPILKASHLRLSGLSDKLTQREDRFMAPILDKIPIVRNSERSYIGFLNGLRADQFYSMLDAARVRGEDISVGSKASKDIANVVNIMTGTKDVGRLERESELFNSVNFSFRKTAADISMLNPVTYINPKTSPTARKEALRSVIGSLAIASGILGLAKATGIGTTETDPRSSDFGKIKIGNMRIDVTGGRAAMVTLLSRLATGQEKSTTTGVMSNLGEGYKPQTRMGLILNFERSKLNPAYGALVDLMVGTDFLGNKVTLPQEAVNAFAPMIISDVVDLSKGDMGQVFTGTLLSLFGIPVTLYPLADFNQLASTSKKLQQFKGKVSDQTFNEANQKYNDMLQKNITALQNDSRFKQLSSQDQQKMMTKLKTNVENKIFQDYHFKYKNQNKGKKRRRIKNRNTVMPAF